MLCIVLKIIAHASLFSPNIPAIPYLSTKRTCVFYDGKHFMENRCILYDTPIHWYI